MPPILPKLGFQKLYKLPYWIKLNDLDFVVDKLEKTPLDSFQGARDLVRYVSVPSGYGKTSLILPAFLRSAEREDGFTHYIYIAFHNNDSRSFVSDNDLYKNELLAEFQGAAFIVECVKNILADQEIKGKKSTIKIDMDEESLRKYDSQKEIDEILSKLSSGERQAKILFHVDEHRKMCTRTNDENDPGASFSKGAMETLAMAKNSFVVATYIDVPDSLPATSSQVCRYPVGLPPIDIENIMEEYTLKDENGNEYHPFHFPFDRKTLKPEEKRLWATLKFKLAVKLTTMGMVFVHYPGDEFRLFCKKFKDTIEETIRANKKKKSLIKEILKACSEICIIELKLEKITRDKAVDLFLGISDLEYETKLAKEKLFDLTVLNNIWTVTFERLLSMDPPITTITDAIATSDSSKLVITEARQNIFLQGQTAMINIINNTDYLSNTPLEIAYRWALPVQSFSSKALTLGGEIFKIDMQTMMPGRIFDGGKAIQINDSLIEEKVKPNTFYYVKEGGRYDTHPLFDLFFLGKNQETKQTLVLIDVTGGGIKTAEEKLKRISNWISEQKLHKFALVGFVIAPGAKMEIKTNASNNVTIIGQNAALKLLGGGLRQIFHWLIEDEENILRKE